ncbi:MAG TPA: S41 family peptidase [Trueperaceae bacterium]|nr:S41 family peptidase [Trueperaceae bacterium]
MVTLRTSDWLARVRSLAVMLALAAAVATASAQGTLTMPGNEVATPATPTTNRGVVFEALVDLFRDYYWNPLHMDWDAWADRHREAATGAEQRPVFDAIMRRMVSEVGDDHSRWIGLRDVADVIGSDAGGQLTGDDGSTQGAEGADDGDADPLTSPGFGLQVRYLAGVGLVVERVLPQTPASEAGLRRGDVIERIDDADIRSLSAGAAGALMTESLQHPTVDLALKRGGREELALTLAPRPLRHSTLGLTASASMLDDGVGYLYLPSFTLAGTGERVHALLYELQRMGARAYVIDMRGNLGGSLGELGIMMGAFYDGEWARAIARDRVAWNATFVRDGAAGFAVLEAEGGRVVREAAILSPVFISEPLVVIVDRDTSSAAEVAAAVLQTSGRAAVVGTGTLGNVEVVQGFELPDGSSVLLAVANLEMPDGRSLADGIVPDVEARASVTELARGYDAALSEAVAKVVGLPFAPGRWF